MPNESNTKSFFLGALLGGIAGGVCGLLFAPKSGQQLRKDIASKYDEFSEKAHEIVNEAGEKIKQFATKGEEVGEEFIDEAKDKAKDVAKHVKKEFKHHA